MKNSKVSFSGAISSEQMDNSDQTYTENIVRKRSAVE